MNRLVVLSVGFRPWFLSLLLMGVVLFGLWGWNWYLVSEHASLPVHFLSTVSDWRWHAHEMIFGLGTALLAGFLLTAVQNWTGQRPLSPTWLLFVVLLWWVARLWILLGGMASWGGFLLSAAVPLWVSVAILRPLVRSRQWHNLIFPAAVATMALLDLYFRFQLSAPAFHDRIAWAGIWPLLAVILFMAQRIVPAFTGNYTGQRNLGLGNAFAWLSGAGPFILLILALIPVPFSPPFVPSVVALILVLAGGYAWGRWWQRPVWQEPMLLILFVGYALLLIGLLLLAGAQLPLFSLPARALWLDAGIHALGLGVLGIFGPGMLLRVSAGHTGRSIQMSGLLRAAFMAAVLFWVLRVATVGVGFHSGLLTVSAWGMAAVYGALLWSIGGWLLRPRAS